jgi:hypothetical protein
VVVLTREPTSSIVTSALVAGVVSMAACGSSSLGGGSGFAVDSGASVLVPSVTEVAVGSTITGALPPPGATCAASGFSSDLIIQSGVFSWSQCDVPYGADPNAYLPVNRSRTLSSDELATAKTAIAGVHVSTNEMCGLVKLSYVMTVNRGDQQMQYGDDFAACGVLYDHYVDSYELNSLASTFSTLSQAPTAGP